MARYGASLSLPRVGRRRLVALVVLCTLASTLWIGSPGWISAIPLLPAAVLSWRLIGYGLIIPWGVGWVTLLLMERRIADDLNPDDEPSPVHDQVGAR